MSAQLPRNHDVFMGKPRSSRASCRARRSGVVTLWDPHLVKDFYPVVAFEWKEKDAPSPLPLRGRPVLMPPGTFPTDVAGWWATFLLNKLVSGVMDTPFSAIFYGNLFDWCLVHLE